MAISLPAMRAVMATLPFKLTFPRQICPVRNASLLLCKAKLQDQLRWRHRFAEAADTPQKAGSPTFEQTGDPLLLIGRDSSRRRQRPAG